MLGLGLALTNFGTKGGISDIADGGLLSSTFLSRYGPYGMAMDFTDSSISINDSTDVLDYSSQGTVSATTGALLGPGSKLVYSAPSAKLTEQADGYLAFQAHNLLQYSEAHGTAPWNTSSAGTGVAPTRTNGYAAGPFGGSATRLQFSLGGGTTTSDLSTVQQPVTPPVTGGEYTRDVWIRSTDGSSSYVMQVQAVDGSATNVAVTGAWTKYTVTGISGGVLSISLRLRGGQTTGAGANSNTADVLVANDHLRRTPSVSTYVATTSAAVYDLPYVFSGGVRTGIMVEPAATNLNLYSTDFTNAAWTKRGITTATKNQTGPDGVANSACRIANLGAVAGVNDFYETAYASVRFTASQAITQSFYIRKVSSSGVLRITNASSGVLYYSIDFSLLGSGWERITPTHPAVTTGTLTATAGGIFGPFFLAQSGSLDFDLYCTQLETGTVATSPIITYGAAVLRALDNIYITTSLFPYSSTTCFLYGEMITPVGGFQNNSTIIALTVDGSAGTGPSAYVQASSTNSVAAWNSGSVTKNYLSSPAAGSTQKMAACFNTSGTLAAATNQGQAVATSAASAWNGTSNRLQIGGLSAFGVQNARAVTSRIMFLPEYDTAKAAAVTA